MSFVGIVCRPLDGDRLKKVGTCFAFGPPGCLLTAAHVVHGLERRGLEKYVVAGPGMGPVPIRAALTCDDVDLAVLITEQAADPFVAADELPAESSHVVISGMTAAGRVDVDARVLHSEAMAVDFAYVGFAVTRSPPCGPGWSGAPVHSEGLVVGVMVAGEADVTVAVPVRNGFAEWMIDRAEEVLT
jgi:hypothetical protein